MGNQTIRPTLYFYLFWKWTCRYYRATFIKMAERTIFLEDGVTLPSKYRKNVISVMSSYTFLFIDFFREQKRTYHLHVCEMTPQIHISCNISTFYAFFWWNITSNSTTRFWHMKCCFIGWILFQGRSMITAQIKVINIIVINLFEL